MKISAKLVGFGCSLGSKFANYIVDSVCFLIYGLTGVDKQRQLVVKNGFQKQTIYVCKNRNIYVYM